MSRRLDIDQQSFVSAPPDTPHPNQWMCKPFGSLTVPHGREHGLVSSSTFSPSPGMIITLSGGPIKTRREI